MSTESPKEEQQQAEQPVKPQRVKGIYLLPNLLTTGAMFSGFYAILASIDGNYEAASIAIFVAMFFDMMDGRVARMTNTQSDFGVQYDSLSDMVSFGVAPAIIAFNWILHSVGKFGWAAAFIYAACAALRLARFNTQAGTADKTFFVGLASPAAAAIVVGLVWSGYELENTTALAGIVAIMTAMSGLLMVSNFKYPSFKDLDVRGKVPFMAILAVVLVISVVTIDPPRILLLMAFVYALSGPIVKLRRTKS